MYTLKDYVGYSVSLWSVIRQVKNKTVKPRPFVVAIPPNSIHHDSSWSSRVLYEVIHEGEVDDIWELP